ncbi:MAG: hypothetical protein ACK4UN_03220 [Limisphaerales bacterium]
MNETSRFAPDANDSIRELRWKAESMLEYLRDQEALLRQFPVGAIDERLQLWQGLAQLLARAMENPELAFDARIEAYRVWGEETHHTAMFIVTMSVYTRSEAAQARFAEDPEVLDLLIERFERSRPAALKVLSTADLKHLREEGFLRAGE